MTASNQAYWRIVPLLAAFWLWPLPATAQDVESRPFPSDTQPTQPHWRARGPAGRRGMDGLVRGLFRAAPEDEGPLQPGEAEELLAFAEQHAPRVYQLMSELRQRDPQQFQEKMAFHAPRLRHLRRIYERSPPMGAIVQAYANDLALIEHRARDLRELHSGLPDSGSYLADLGELRRWVTKNVDRECEALELMADEIEAQRDERIEKRVAYLTGEEPDLATEPEELRTLITAFHSTATDAERATLRDKIQSAAARQVKAETTALRLRAARLREDVAQEVERRVKQLLQPPGRHGQRHGGAPDSSRP